MEKRLYSTVVNPHLPLTHHEKSFLQEREFGICRKDTVDFIREERRDYPFFVYAGIHQQNLCARIAGDQLLIDGRDICEDNLGNIAIRVTLTVNHNLIVTVLCQQLSDGLANQGVAYMN